MSRIYKRGKTWYADFEYKGQRHRKSLGTGSKQMAALALKDIDIKMARDRFDFHQPVKSTFQDFADKFLEWYKVQNSAKSYQDYRNLFRSTIMPHFAKYDLAGITLEMIEKYKQERSRRISPSTVNKELVALRHVFNKAILWGYLKQNPAKEVAKLPVKERKFRFLSLAEIQQCLDACPDYAKPIFITALHTGLRRSELFRLEWPDVDFDRRCISVVNKDDAHTKNYRNREVPMTPLLFDTLKELRHAASGHSTYVFVKADGTQHKGEFRKTLRRIVTSTGIEPFGLHDLRHTFASHLVMEGVDLPTAQKLLGHSDIKTTMIYAHLAPDHLKKAIQKLHDRFDVLPTSEDLKDC